MPHLLLGPRRRLALRVATTVLAVTALVGPTAARSGADAGLKAPTGLAVVGASESSIALTWTAGHGRPAERFALARDGHEVGSTNETSYTFAGLACGHAYLLGVQALDAAGNRSEPASLVAATAPCAAPAPPPPQPTPVPPEPTPVPPVPPPTTDPPPPAPPSGDPATSPDDPAAERPDGPVPPRPDRGAPPANAGWEGAGAFVWHETHADPEALASDLRENGFSWVAVLLHDGLRVDSIEDGWVSRFRAAAPGLAVGGWGVLRDDPEREAELAVRLVGRHELDFYIANAEAEYKLTSDDGQNAERFGRSKRFVTALRSRRPHLTAALSSYCRADRQDLDWDAWNRAGFAFLPQAYVNDFGAAASPAACAAGAAGFFAPEAVHPTVGTYRGQQGAPTVDRYAALLAEAGTVGFSVYLAETQMSARAWRVLGDAIATQGIARTKPRTVTRNAPV